MLNIVLRYLRNFFVFERYTGYFSIVNGTIQLPVRLSQHYLIEGSGFNNGVHKPGDTLTDETFNGCVSILAIPEEVLTLVTDIESWCSQNADAAVSPFQSESFGGYSYQRKSGANGSSFCWQDAFKDRLSIWRKL